MVLHSPNNEDDFERLIELCDYSIDQTGGKDEHPLLGLLDIVGTLI